jgi:hypothetical protein
MWRCLFVVGLLGLLAACGSDTSSTRRASYQPPPLETPGGHFTGGIVLLRDRVDVVRAYIDAFPQEYVRGSLEYLAERDVDEIPNTETAHTVVFFLDQEPPPGIQVRTTHQFQRFQNGELVSLEPYKFTYETGPSSNPIIVLNESQAGGANGYLVYRLYVGEELAAIKRVEIVVR